MLRSLCWIHECCCPKHSILKFRNLCVGPCSLFFFFPCAFSEALWVRMELIPKEIFLLGNFFFFPLHSCSSLSNFNCERQLHNYRCEIRIHNNKKYALRKQTKPTNKCYQQTNSKLQCISAGFSKTSVFITLYSVFINYINLKVGTKLLWRMDSEYLVSLFTAVLSLKCFFKEVS